MPESATSNPIDDYAARDYATKDFATGGYVTPHPYYIGDPPITPSTTAPEIAPIPGGLIPPYYPQFPPSYIPIQETEWPQIVKVKYFDNELEKLEYIGEGVSDWVDLRAAVDLRIWRGEFHLIPLGVAIEIPKGYEALVVPRSSTFKNWGLIQANSMGVIDEAFCGDNDQWHLPVYATQTTRIHKNDRICQFRIIKHQPALIFTEVDSLGNPDRNGFGSTGKR